MLEVKNLNFKYEKTKPILNNLNLQFESGKVIAIQGESGAGKSTLLAILSGLEKEYEGELVFNDKIIGKSDLHQYNKENVSIIFQDLNLIKYLNLKENIKQGCAVKGKKLDENRLNAYVDTLNLRDLDLEKYPLTLSGGQQQRIAIIRALLSNTKIILADEPTASIDSKNSKAIIEELKLLAQQEDKIIIVITHNNSIAMECHERYQLENGNMEKS